MPSPSARSFILDLLSTLRRGSMPVAALVRAGALFDLGESAIRVALVRLRADGRIDRDERGHYRLGSAAEPIQAVVGSWRHIERRTIPWEGAWLAVQGTPGGEKRRVNRGTAQALRLMGFAPLNRGLALRPANLVEGVGEVRDKLHALGLSDAALVFQLQHLDPANEARARSLWNVEELLRGYRDSQAQMAESGARLAELDAPAAMVESFVLGGRVIQQLVLDPLLPESILDPSERSALVEATRDYDRLGRATWARFLADYGLPHLTEPSADAPAGSGLAASADRLAAHA